MKAMTMGLIFCLAILPACAVTKRAKAFKSSLHEDPTGSAVPAVPPPPPVPPVPPPPKPKKISKREIKRARAERRAELEQILFSAIRNNEQCSSICLKLKALLANRLEGIDP